MENKPKERQYFQRVGSGWIRLHVSVYESLCHIYTKQGRTSISPMVVVECPESNCRVLVQSNGGQRGRQMSETWLKNKK